MSKIRIEMWHDPFTKWWCHVELARQGYDAADQADNKAAMGRYGGAAEMAVERFNEAGNPDQGIRIDLTEAQAAVIRTRMAQHIQDWKAACDADDLSLMRAAGVQMWNDWDEIRASFPDRLAPTGNETEKP